MFNSIAGIITEKGIDSLYILTGGIEWDITVPSSTLTKMASVGSEGKVFIYLHHNDMGMKLYGFSGRKERTLFLSLLKVGGIGPKQAIKILSGISVSGFVEALDNEDINELTRLPGLGKKTAQKIVLSLRGKLTFGESEAVSADDELTEALINMGFDKKSAKKAVKDALTQLETEELSGDELEKAVFKKAIVLLSSK